MGTVLAALDDSAAAAPVMATARALAEVFDASLEALTVRANGAGEEAAAAAAGAGVPLREIRGVAVERLINVGNRPDIEALVIGARGARFGKRPLGSTATAVATSVPRPVVVVPPDARPRERVRRVLVPVERPAEEPIAPRSVPELAPGASLDVVVLHVYDGEAPPELELQLGELLSRYAPRGIGAIELELRRGRPEDVVPAAAEELDVDLVALTWARALEPGRAPVVQAALGRPIPVLLIPVEVRPTDEGNGAAQAPETEGGER